MLTRDAIQEAVTAGAEVVVLPELVTSGYVFASAEEAASVAIGRDHPIIVEWVAQAAAAGIVLAAGFCERGERRPGLQQRRADRPHGAAGRVPQAAPLGSREAGLHCGL